MFVITIRHEAESVGRSSGLGGTEHIAVMYYVLSGKCDYTTGMLFARNLPACLLQYCINPHQCVSVCVLGGGGDTKL